VIIFEVKASAPNNSSVTGQPRVFPSGLGWISNVCLKHKIREMIEDHTNPVSLEILKMAAVSNADSFHIFESRKKGFSDLTEADATDAALKMFEDDGDDGLARYFDLRLFGTTMIPEREMSKVQFTRTGAVQFSHAVSVLPIEIVIDGLTKMAPLVKKHLENGKEGLSDKEMSVQGTGTMGNDGLRMVEHGIYVCHYSINPFMAHKTHMTDKDVDVLKTLIPLMFSKSAANRMVLIRQAFHVKHNNSTGSFNPIGLHNICQPRPVRDVPVASTSSADYIFTTEEDVKKWLGTRGMLEMIVNM
jgi:Cas7 group CRISPR-associated protein Csh2